MSAVILSVTSNGGDECGLRRADKARPRAGSHPVEASSPRILPAFADRTHFYHAVSGQFPATARQCVN